MIAAVAHSFLAETGADAQVVTLLSIIAAVLAGAGVVLVVARLIARRRAVARSATSVDGSSPESPDDEVSVPTADNE